MDFHAHMKSDGSCLLTTLARHDAVIKQWIAGDRTSHFIDGDFFAVIVSAKMRGARTFSLYVPTLVPFSTVPDEAQTGPG